MEHTLISYHYSVYSFTHPSVTEGYMLSSIGMDWPNTPSFSINFLPESTLVGALSSSCISKKLLGDQVWMTISFAEMENDEDIVTTTSQDCRLMHKIAIHRRCDQDKLRPEWNRHHANGCCHCRNKPESLSCARSSCPCVFV